MKKIPTLFLRNHETDNLVRDEITPGCEWVIIREGRPTKKLDGTCCMIRDGKLFKRYELKPEKTPPDNFQPIDVADPVTGKCPGWVPVGLGPEDRWHRCGWNMMEDGYDQMIPNSRFPTPYLDGTYELLGSKIQGNPEELRVHVLIRHGAHELLDVRFRTFHYLKEFLQEQPIEGIVWHHPDGRMAKLKKRDFGFKRQPTHGGPV